MTESSGGCLSRAGHEKNASGVVVYLIEELGDARLRTAQLKKYVQEAVDLIDKAENRDQLFEVAGHLIHGIPDMLFKLDKALDASAMAAARLDYEEIKQNLKPEKAEELEDVLQDIRLPYLKRRSEDATPKSTQIDNVQRTTPMKNTKEAAAELIKMAEIADATGKVPVARLVSLIAHLEGNQRQAGDISKKASRFFQQAATTLSTQKNPSRTQLASVLRKVLADSMQMDAATMQSAIFQQANSREEVMKGFQKANPSMSDADAEKAADQWEKNKNVVKDKH